MREPDLSEFYETIFIGAGISCLAAARKLRGDYIILEAEDRPGGMCRTDKKDGFSFDRTGHLLHLTNPKTKKWLGQLLKQKMELRQRSSWIYSNGVYTRYPFQSHFYGLPAHVAAECLEGIFHAHYQRLGKKRPAGYRSQSFSRWVMERFGKGVAKHFLFPYNTKLWTVKPHVLTTEWLGRFVPRPDLHQVVMGAIADIPQPEGYNSSFMYPKTGGIETLVKTLGAGLKIRTNARVTGIHLKNRELLLADGQRMKFGKMVSSAPLPSLVKMSSPVPDSIYKHSKSLRAASVYNLNLGIVDRNEKKHWVYVPENNFSIYRFGYANNFSSSVAPPGHAAVYTELSFRMGTRPDLKSLRKHVIDDLKKIGVIGSRGDIVTEHVNLLEGAYAIFDRHRTPAVRAILRFFRRRDIHPIGRWGTWSYGSMEDAILQGIEVANYIKGHPPS